VDLKCLLLCEDDKIVRVLRRTLGDLEISVQHCTSSEAALGHLTRERFEAIIVDCAGPGAAAVLRSARIAPCNKRAVAVAILDHGVGLRSAFELGAHFILYKPVSVERAKSSFRAARALMKKERRRNARIPVQIPIEMWSVESSVRLKAHTTDLGEGGLAANLPRRSKAHGRWQLKFTLPGSSTAVDVAAEFAWEGNGTQIGLRFQDQSPVVAKELREWAGRNSPEIEKDDPPAPCRLTDLSLGGCYLEMPSPFPMCTRVTLSMRAAGVELKTEGVVRVMHAEKGMGVEFTKTTAEHRAKLEKFLELLSANRELLPELLVEAEGLETESSQNTLLPLDSGVAEDPLIGLFRNQSALSVDLFTLELHKQRGTAAAGGVSA
jgi:CheY-like chemotaxis protein